MADLVERTSRHARAMAEELDADPALEVLNEVVINQVLVAIRGDADGEATAAAVERIQDDGTCWLAGTTWRGRPRDPDLGLQLAHDRGRRAPLRHSHPRSHPRRGAGRLNPLLLLAASRGVGPAAAVDHRVLAAARCHPRVNRRLSGAYGPGVRSAAASAVASSASRIAAPSSAFESART